jgi:hypothetical protein
MTGGKSFLTGVPAITHWPGLANLFGEDAFRPGHSKGSPKTTRRGGGDIPASRDKTDDQPLTPVMK